MLCKPSLKLCEHQISAAPSTYVSQEVGCDYACCADHNILAVATDSNFSWMEGMFRWYSLPPTAGASPAGKSLGMEEKKKIYIARLSDIHRLPWTLIKLSVFKVYSQRTLPNTTVAYGAGELAQMV